MQFFHNYNVFGSCIIHILYTECARIKKIIPAPEGLGMRAGPGQCILHDPATATCSKPLSLTLQ